MRIPHIDKFRFFDVILYTILYTVTTLPLSVLLEHIFPEPNRDKSSPVIFLEILLQIILIVVLVYFIQKIIQILIHTIGLREHRVFEYEGAVTIPIVFVNTQHNLMEKITIIHNRMINNIKK